MACTPRTSQVGELLELVRRQDPVARGRLMDYASSRLKAMAQAMIRSNRVRRWEQSDDLLQQTLLRLDRAMERVRTTDVRAFLNLAALEMRHALIDFARHYFGQCGLGANYESGTDRAPRASRPLHIFVSRVGATDEALLQQERWERLYLAIGELPDEERQVVELVWIHQLNQLEAAEVLEVSDKTVRRRWRRARIRLCELMAGELPEL